MALSLIKCLYGVVVKKVFSSVFLTMVLLIWFLFLWRLHFRFSFLELFHLSPQPHCESYRLTKSFLWVLFHNYKKCKYCLKFGWLKEKVIQLGCLIVTDVLRLYLPGSSSSSVDLQSISLLITCINNVIIATIRKVNPRIWWKVVWDSI